MCARATSVHKLFAIFIKRQRIHLQNEQRSKSRHPHIIRAAAPSCVARSEMEAHGPSSRYSRASPGEKWQRAISQRVRRAAQLNRSAAAAAAGLFHKSRLHSLQRSPPPGIGCQSSHGSLISPAIDATYAHIFVHLLRAIKKCW